MNFSRLISAKRARVNAFRRRDLVTEQVKKVLADTDQKLILMVRG